MGLMVDVLVDPAAGERPPPGTPIRVELRDTSLADAPARTIATAETIVGDLAGDRLASVEMPVGIEPAEGTTVWAHVDVTGGGEVAKGDYVTMQSHPVPSPELQPAHVPVTVRPVH